jgi:hypothetical protein
MVPEMEASFLKSRIPSESVKKVFRLNERWQKHWFMAIQNALDHYCKEI